MRNVLKPPNHHLRMQTIFQAIRVFYQANTRKNDCYHQGNDSKLQLLALACTRIPYKYITRSSNSTRLFGLSFERPYLIKGLNLMIAKSMKSAVFDVDFSNFTDLADFNANSMDFDVDFTDFADFHADFTDFGLKLVKLTISFHSTVRIQGGNVNFYF